MSSLIQALQSFVAYFYNAINSVTAWFSSVSSYITTSWYSLYTVSNVVCPPALQGLLAIMISIMVAFLIAKVVIHLIP